MKIVQKPFYVCEICRAEYDNQKIAENCEKKEYHNPQNVKMGDIVEITWGYHVGVRFKVEWIGCREFSHTIVIAGKCINAEGSIETWYWDDYKVIQE